MSSPLETLTLPEVKKFWEMAPEATFKRVSWDDCKIIRQAKDSDYDLINYDIDGTIVEDCPGRQCDCKIGVWAMTPEDKQAKDYFRVYK